MKLNPFSKGFVTALRHDKGSRFDFRICTALSSRVAAWETAVRVLEVNFLSPSRCTAAAFGGCRERHGMSKLAISGEK